MLVLELVKDHTDIAVAESLSVTREPDYKRIGNLLVIDAPFKERYKKISYMKRIYSLVGICDRKEDLSSLDWNKHYHNNFSLKAHGGLDQRSIAGIVFRSIADAKVKLKDADTKFHIFRIGEDHIALKAICNQPQSFEDRKPSTFPAFHPSSLHPRLARAMINLTGIRKGKILDPCCGSGGILIEAGLMGLSPVGIDIEEDMIERARKNTTHFKIPCKLKNDDCLRNKEKFDYIVSDLPYGKNTRSQDLESFYIGFSKMLKRCLGKRAVIGILDSADPDLFCKDLKIRHKFSYPLHRKLAKTILVLEKDV